MTVATPARDKKGRFIPRRTAHDKARERVAKIQQEHSFTGRDISPLPPIKDLERRRACMASLQLFDETYLGATFNLPWCPDLLEANRMIEACVRHGRLQALSMPRGGGKTSICRAGALWAVACGLSRYVAIFGSNDEKAKEAIDAITKFLVLAPFADDFPEISYPIQRLEGISTRARGQHLGGDKTLIRLSATSIILPTVKPPAAWPKDWPLRSDGMVPTSGGAISASGLTAEGIRGSLLTLSTGESIRPDVALCDDPQTDESAKSPAQSDLREQLIKATILGMAGPGKKLSCMVPCTPIVPGDLAMRLLDNHRNPAFNGTTTKMVNKWPAHPEAKALWEKYIDLRKEGMERLKDGGALGNLHYVANREKMDLGAEMAWPENHPEGTLSALQYAYNIIADRGLAVLMAEYQGEPLPLIVTDVDELTPDQIASKLQGPVCTRGVVPMGSEHITAFIDVHQTVLYYVVCAWHQNFTGTVIDYGTWPEQHRQYYSLADCRETLQKATGASDMEGSIYAGLDALTATILGGEWKREDGAPMRIGRCLIDANWGQGKQPVYLFVRQSAHSAVLLPSHGRYIGAASVPMNQYRPAEGEKSGFNWRITLEEQTRQRRVIFDTNFWKSFIHSRLAVSMGSAGCLALWGDKPDNHRLFADHITAEYRVKTAQVKKEGMGRTVEEWKWRPERRDNHFFDCLVGNAVAASMLGCSLKAHGDLKPKVREVSYRQMWEDAQKNKGAT